MTSTSLEVSAVSAADVEFGVRLGGTLPPSEYARFAEHLEVHGFHAATVSGDLMMQPPALPLATMAAASGRLRLGVGCYTPWTLHPVEIARQLAYLDHLSDGRIFMGVARGARMTQLRIDQSNALSAIEDCVNVVRTLLAQADGGYRGRVYRLAPNAVAQYPIRRAAIPLMIGTWSPVLAAYAGEHADEIQLCCCANADMVAVMREYAIVGSKRAGRPADEPRIVLAAVTVVDDHADVARSRARTEVARSFHEAASLDSTFETDPEVLTRMAPFLLAGDYESAGRLIPDDALARFTFSGNADQIVEQAMGVYAAGAARIEFGAPFGTTPHRGIELLGRRVLPALRAVLGEQLSPVRQVERSR